MRKKGQTNSGSFQKGQKPWWVLRGLPHPSIGRHLSEEEKLHHSQALKGKKFSEDRKQKLSEIHKELYKNGAFVPSMKGRTSSLRGKKRPEFAKENNPNWQGGTTEKHLYQREVWKRLIVQIWKRDAFTCQLCGIQLGRGVKPVVHHRIPHFLLPEDNEGNLITLCNSCHLKVHWKIKKEGDFIFA